MHRIHRRAGFAVPTAVTGVLALLSMVWFAMNAAAPWGPGWAGWVFGPIVILVNQVQLLRLRRTPGISPEGRRFWRHLAAVQVLIIAATLVTAWDTLSSPQTVTLAGPSNALYGCAVLGVLWAVLRLPAREPIRGSAIVRFALDAAVVVLTVGLFGWYVSLRDYAQLLSAFALILFACATALAFGKLALAGARGVDRRTMNFLGVTVIVSSMTGALLTHFTSRPDLNAATVSMTLTFFLFSLVIERERSRAGRPAPVRRPRRSYSLVPYLAIAATDGLLLHTRGGSREVTVVAVALTAIVVGRQILAFRDNSRLLSRLDTTLEEVRRAQLQLAHQAHHDALTGLANRRLFEQRLATSLATGDQFAVMLIDLDDFKSVNDTLGHHVGDRLLIEVGDRMLSSVGDRDVVARLGGDEFALILTCGPAAEVLDRLSTAMAQPVVVDGHRLPVRCSVGWAVSWPEAGPVELLRRADVAMYAAKAAGKGRSARYEPTMETVPTF